MEPDTFPLAGNCWAGSKIKQAHFFGTADNSLILWVNGREAGRSDDSGEGWRQPAQLDATALMKPGANQLALSAVNATDTPSPAGVIGRLVIEFEQGEPRVAALDETWKAANQQQPGWNEAGFNDAARPAAQVFARFGGWPWGRLGGGRLTLSPVKASPLVGHCDLPADIDLTRSRVYLEMDGLAPEAAARVTVNGHDAGGFLGAPLRLPVTPHLQTGRNDIRIEPFAPPAARLVFYAE